MRIIARINNGEEIPIAVDKKARIIDIKIRILASIPKLVYWDAILDDDKTIDKYDIFDGDAIDFVSGLRADEMIIFVRHIDGMLFPFVVKISDKIIDVKREIQEKKGFPMNGKKLFYCDENDGTELYDEQTIGECEIPDDHYIYIADDWKKGGTQIDIKVKEEAPFSIDILGSYQIKNIKYDIQKQKGMRRSEQILKYKGVTLDDDKTLDDYGIQHNCEIELVAKSIINNQ